MKNNKKIERLQKRLDSIPWKIYSQKPGEKGRMTVQKVTKQWFMEQCEAIRVTPDWLLNNFLWHSWVCKKWRSETKKQLVGENDPRLQLLESLTPEMQGFQKSGGENDTVNRRQGQVRRGTDSPQKRKSKVTE